MASLLRRNADAFPDDLPPGLPRTHDLNIFTDSNVRPTQDPTIRLSPTLLKRAIDEVRALLKAGNIAKGRSPYAASLLFAQKKYGSLRMCCDLRALSKIIVKVAFPAPHAQDLFDATRGAKFLTIDLRSGYFL